jgi:hypothetical protein
VLVLFGAATSSINPDLVTYDLIKIKLRRYRGHRSSQPRLQNRALRASHLHLIRSYGVFRLRPTDCCCVRMRSLMRIKLWRKQSGQSPLMQIKTERP